MIYLGRKIDIQYTQLFIARELINYLEAHPEHLGNSGRVFFSK